MYSVLVAIMTKRPHLSFKGRLGGKSRELGNVEQSIYMVGFGSSSSHNPKAIKTQGAVILYIVGDTVEAHFQLVATCYLFPPAHYLKGTQPLSKVRGIRIHNF